MNRPIVKRRRDSADGQRVQRFDRAPASLAPGERTAQGYMRVHAAVAVPGVLEYQDAAGNVTRELVTPEHLHRADSLQTLASMPITVDHPDEDVTPDNVGELGVGDVSEEIEVLQETGHVRITMVIRRRDGLQAVEDGITEISPGYTTVIDPTPGTHPEFGPYDAIQTQRRYNHVALVDEARGGPTIRLRTDGAKHAIARFDTKPKPPNPDPKPAEAFMHPTLLTLAALLALPFEQRKDGKVFRTDAEGEDEPAEASEADLTAAVADAIRGLQDAIAGAASGGKVDQDEGADALKAELQQALAKVAELQGKLQVLEQEKTDRDEAEQAKADAAERERLDKLAKALDFDAATWREDTANDARKLDLVRHKGVVETEETPDPARVNGMIDTLYRLHADSADGDGDDDRRDGDQWGGLSKQVEDKPDADDRADKAPADPFKAAIAKRRTAS